MPKKSPAPETLPDGGWCIDSHCHLQSLTDDERTEALDTARARGVRGFLVPSIHVDDGDFLLELCHAHDDIWCGVGCHPHYAEEWRDGDLERLRRWAEDPKVVAIGECGLDFFYDHSPREQQERIMRAQWELAVELGLPVIVHNRESNDTMLEVFRDPSFDGLIADFHSFAGGLEMAEAIRERVDGHDGDAYFGLSGMITFNRADNVREILGSTSPERLLIETDTPYLAPVPYRGKPNRPGYVVEVLDRLARELGRSIEETARLTNENFFRLFSRASTQDWAGT